jgi:hypothetical protein
MMQMTNEQRRSERRRQLADLESSATEAVGLWQQIVHVRNEIVAVEKMPPTFTRLLQSRQLRERLYHLTNDHAAAQARRRRLSDELGMRA